MKDRLLRQIYLIMRSLIICVFYRDRAVFFLFFLRLRRLISKNFLPATSNEERERKKRKKERQKQRQY